MRWAEVATRLNGVSIGPFGGVSWTPPRSDDEAARAAITRLEDHAALYDDYAEENPAWVIQSILAIRREMTEIMAPGGLSAELTSSLRMIRAACRKFTNSIGAHTASDGRLHVPPGGFGQTHNLDLAFVRSLGELRGVVGVEVAKIAVAYKLDVEDGLASILPTADTETTDDEPTEVVLEQPRTFYLDSPEP